MSTPIIPLVNPLRAARVTVVVRCVRVCVCVCLFVFCSLSLSNSLILPLSLPPSSDSDEDFEESYTEGYSNEPILEPRDPYSFRPLPVKIGTPAFLNEDDVGLGDYASGSEGEGRGRGQVM